MSKGQEPLILSIETATRAGSIAVSRGRTLLSTRTGDATRSHSTDLLELIRGALEEATCRIQEVELFAVALGPGSFTGLRIGVATVKSLASTLERKAVGVQTLHAIALAAGEGERVVALLPAGRGELFAQSFRVEEPFAVVPLDEPGHVAPTALLEKFRSQRTIRWAGEGALAQREKIRVLAEEEGIAFIEESVEKVSDKSEGWVLSAPPENLAEYVGLLAFEKQVRGETSKPEELHAIYVRPSDAELKEKCRTQG
ncbi:MAG TPA: tRNA (adenosine(37)-N6)-threonylcarbamoyltransferase complex dimerization subunit type 1 TsaB [Pyrinomonadaceae bacterium]